MNDFERCVLCDGCDGDSAGLTEALGDDYEVVYQSNRDYGYGHHSYDEVYKLADGRYIAANCGGCSCHGNGDWCYENSQEMAMRFVPEDKK